MLLTREQQQTRTGSWRKIIISFACLYFAIILFCDQYQRHISHNSTVALNETTHSILNSVKHISLSAARSVIKQTALDISTSLGNITSAANDLVSVIDDINDFDEHDVDYIQESVDDTMEKNNRRIMMNNSNKQKPGESNMMRPILE